MEAVLLDLMGVEGDFPKLANSIPGTALAECMPAGNNFSNFDTALHCFVDYFTYLLQDLFVHCLTTKPFTV